MIIKILENKDQPRWDRFIEENDSVTFFHQLGWKNVIEKIYGHKPLYLFAEVNGKIVGILPLFMINNFIFGKRLVSVPYSPYGGCVAIGNDAKEALISSAIKHSREYKYMELRNNDIITGMPTNYKNVTMILNLTQGETSVWSNIRKGMKACINKAAKKEFNVILDSENLRAFYSLYCQRMRELGTPVHPFGFFRSIQDNFTNMEIATIDYQGEILASQLLFYFKNTVIYGWGASTNRYSDWHPVHALLWQVIKNCVARGYTDFDFGRSAPDSGTYNFKKWWGAEPRQLYYQYNFSKGREIPYDHPSNPKYSIAIKLWQTLPLPVANWLGPILRKNLI
jgi:serine/alanine adding enzyme